MKLFFTLYDITIVASILMIFQSLALKHGFKDGDCAEALKIPEMIAALAYIKSHGCLPVGGFNPR
jgi:hypothetical protein